MRITCDSPALSEPAISRTLPRDESARSGRGAGVASHAREAVLGLFRSRRPPIWRSVWGSTDMFPAPGTQGWRRETRLTPGTITSPRCGSGGQSFTYTETKADYRFFPGLQSVNTPT